jgi:hypothetical protein
MRFLKELEQPTPKHLIFVGVQIGTRMLWHYCNFRMW